MNIEIEGCVEEVNLQIICKDLRGQVSTEDQERCFFFFLSF